MTNTTESVTEPMVSRFRAAYELTLPEMHRLPDHELMHVNLDVGVAVTTALGAWPEIKQAREEIASKLPAFDLTSFDTLERYALATGHAHALVMVAQSPSAALPELGDRALKLRDLLWTDATALAKRGLLEGARIKDLRSSTGYRNVAFDLLGLVAVMRESWSRIAGKTAIDPNELDTAEQLADRLISEVGLREQGPATLAAAGLNRQRAFTLFVRAYDQARRALSYLRWGEGDLDTIAPSLYARRRRAAEPESDIPPAPSATPATPAPTAPNNVTPAST